MMSSLPADNSPNRKSILIVTFHYPPGQVSSGLLRSLAFSRDLSNLGWDVSVLTANPKFVFETNDANENILPKNVEIFRTFAIDAANHLAIGGKYPAFLEKPDRYGSWVVSAVLKGLRIIKSKNIDLLFSTYPTTSAQLVGYELAKRSGLPWIADFRDPMIMENHPDTPGRRKSNARVELKVMERASACLVTNSRAKTLLTNKFSTYPKEKIYVVENGYDEALFSSAETFPGATEKRKPKFPLRVLHSGTLYPDHRNPEPLFRILKELKLEGYFSQHPMLFKFRGAGYEAYFRTMVAEYQIEDIVEFLPGIPYVESLAEMIEADALLLIQGASCAAQVPAKLYEYFRTKKPLICLTPTAGATGEILLRHGLVTMDESDSHAALREKILAFILALHEGKGNNYVPSVSVGEHSRTTRSALLDGIARNTLELYEK